MGLAGVRSFKRRALDAGEELPAVVGWRLAAAVPSDTDVG
jgi:hypothetical protein